MRCSSMSNVQFSVCYGHACAFCAGCGQWKCHESALIWAVKVYVHPSEQAIHNALGGAGRSIQNCCATAAQFKTSCQLWLQYRRNRCGYPRLLRNLQHTMNAILGWEHLRDSQTLCRDLRAVGGLHRLISELRDATNPLLLRRQPNIYECVRNQEGWFNSL